jgi:hypothetical protein
MTFEEFTRSLEEQSPPQRLSPVLESLWQERKGHWEKAHSIAQEVGDVKGARVHAYLHRREGDISNAEYWYGRARTTNPNTSLDLEWEQLVREFLAEE